MKNLPVNDLRRQTAALKDEIAAAVERVVGSGWYILGQEGVTFEREFANYCGTAECVGVANGTDALELSFRALEIGPGTRVATVANAGGYVTAALNLVGATPIYADVDPDNQLMDLAKLEALTSSGQIDAVVITHLFGRLHDMDAVLAMARGAGIPIIEDCAQAHGARRGDGAAGSFGNLACFSFYPTKNLGALGDAGAITTNDPALADRLRRLRQYGWEGKYQVRQKGGRNSRLDEIQAAVLRAKLPYLEGWNARRRDIATRFSTAIMHPRVKCPHVSGEDHVAHLYVIACEDRDALRKHLAEAGIQCEIHYPVPDHLQPALKQHSAELRLPVSESLAQQVLTLPCFPELTDAEVDDIVERVNAWR